MNYIEAEQQIGQYIAGIFQGSKPFPYHNLQHTKRVVEHAAEIAAFYALGEEGLFIVKTAAWFHDIGQLSGGIQDHEARGVRLMLDYFQRQRLPMNLAGLIANCIMATRFPSQPGTLLEYIICDADTFHLGTPVFRQTDMLVRQEMEMRTGRQFPHWYRSALQFLKVHVFFTDYCRRLLLAGKQENIHWLELMARKEGHAGIK
ncbi:MAG TPA: HD domain-containing protein [Chitinophaga sp.]|uniref:HD domain-containing protein n=1 Tax=Chitinophaga sp. TaxID=1869181 RepID=UPI002DB8C4F4|nr:HD domain-containing protein [Chitinophaga sp.]HEU4553726.1 HD domain-containing protein [Chitinophaga sp.]